MMPDIPVIDAHVHLWDPTQLRIPWLDSDPLLNHPYLLSSYREQTQSVPIERLVYVQVDAAPQYGLIEAEWINALAEQEPLIGGIVAYAPLEDGNCIQSYLPALTRLGSRIKGVRRLLQDESDPAFCLQPGFVRGVQLLPAYGLSCDICIRASQLPSAIALVERCPDTAFVLDHMGKPEISTHNVDTWRKEMTALAAHPHVFCKVSGLVTEADHNHWRPEDLAPYIEHVLHVFGEDRILFGGDWPVVLHAAPYRRWVETLDALTAHLSEVARRKLWAENARSFYRLE